MGCVSIDLIVKVPTETPYSHIISEYKTGNTIFRRAHVYFKHGSLDFKQILFYFQEWTRCLTRSIVIAVP